ncbi:hypothetical protein [Wukongibacter sp. M2B1]|uniref:DUF4376 domain-containing protein n=1 Tax=Wukongibacter sp. M2B1 TaxID=3088895 RepID=UPI003D7A146B
MGKVINKDKLLESVKKLNLSESDYEKIVGEKCPSIELDDYKNYKIQELKTACNAEILGGFYSNANGEYKHYGLSYEDQINLEGIKNNLAMNIIAEATYYASGEECKPYIKEQFLQLYNEAMSFKTERITTCKLLVNQVKEMNSVDLIKSITWEEVEWNE